MPTKGRIVAPTATSAVLVSLPGTVALTEICGITMAAATAVAM